MNEDSGGTASKDDVYCLSGAEEAALLAEYGTEGPLDDSIDWAAPSHFKSHLGGGDVFLTGAAAPTGFDDDSTDDINCVRNDLCATSRGTHTDPLIVYLLRNAPLLILPTRSTPASLVQPVSNLLDTLDVAEEARDSEEGSIRRRKSAVTTATAYKDGKSCSMSRFVSVLRNGKEWERRASLAVQGVPTAAFASYLISSEDTKGSVNPPASTDAPTSAAGNANSNEEASLRDVEYDNLIGATTKMLQDADYLLESLSSPVDNARVEQYVGELRRREALVSEDVLDQHWEREEVLHADDDDESTRKLLRQAQMNRERLRFTLASTPWSSTDKDQCAENCDGGDVSQAVAAAGQTAAALIKQEKEDAQVECEKKSAESSGPPPEANYLYAFEMQLPRLLTSSDTVDLATTEANQATTATISLSSREATLQAREEVLVSYFPAPAIQEATTKQQTEQDDIPQLILRSAALLEDIAKAEHRDTQMMEQFTNAQAQSTQLKLRSNQQGGTPEVRVTKNRNRDALGLMVLPSFVERLDALLSPTREEQQERDRRNGSSECVKTDLKSVPNTNRVSLNTGNEHAEECHQQKHSGGLPTSCTATGTTSTTVALSVAASLEEIRRQAAIESFLLQRELDEARRMRREEDLVVRETLAAEELRRVYTDRLAALQEDACRARTMILIEEAAALEELSTARVKDAALARQAERLRQLQQVEALAFTLMMEWEVHREQLLQDETLSFRRLTRDEAEAKTQAAAAAEKRENAEAAVAHAYVRHMQDAFEQSRFALCAISAKGKTEKGNSGNVPIPFQCTFWYHWRVQPLLQERAHILQWVVAQRRQLENVCDLLQDGEMQYLRHVKITLPMVDPLSSRTEHIVNVPAAPPTKPSSGTEVETNSTNHGVLTAEKLLHVMWPVFRAAVMAPTQAAQFLERWCLSLEDIDSLDWQDLRSLVLRPLKEREKEQKELEVSVAASQLVKDIDLSGNALRSIDVLQAVRTFPLLQRLSLSHASLQTLDLANLTQTTAPTASQQHQQCQSSARDSASLSVAQVGTNISSASTSASHLRHISAARNHAFAEHVHLLEVDLSSNHLSSLSPLGVMATSSLTRCAAMENKITSLESVAACTQLRVVTVAHNKLESVECLYGLRLLRELDVGNNELTEVNEAAGLEQSSGTSAGTNVATIWSKLFVSHNRLTQTPFSQQYVHSCLSELFINHNELTALSADRMAWFPLLRVLQAESNKLVDITGLQHCTRLESVKLSYNQLSTIETLYPLASCRRLKVLDLSGNPLFSDGRNSEKAQEAVRTICNILPWLGELNNKPLLRQVRFQKESEKTALLLVPQNLRGSAVRFDFSLPNSGTVSAFESYAEVFTALCWDDVVQHAQDEREWREALIVRELNRARGWEATIMAQRAAEDEHRTTSNREDTNSAVSSLYEITAAQRDTRRAEHEAEMNLFALDRATVSNWIRIAEQLKNKAHATFPLQADFVLFSNRHVAHSAYRQREDDHFKQLARAYIAEWLFERVLIRRARRELRDLQTAHRQSEAFRREVAVRRIQPVWRGAALRSRLRRLLHGNNDVDGDDDTFAKVNVNDWLTEDPSALAPVELLLHSVVDSAREIAAVPFDVPLITAPAKVDSIVAATVGGAKAGQSSSLLTQMTSPGSEPRRANTGSATSGRPAPCLPKPRAESAAGSGSSTSKTEKPMKSAETLEEQWGPTVAAQIRRKQQKSMRANHERMRKEFMLDPLRVQQEMRGTHSGHKTK